MDDLLAKANEEQANDEDTKKALPAENKAISSQAKGAATPTTVDTTAESGPPNGDLRSAEAVNNSQSQKVASNLDIAVEGNPSEPAQLAKDVPGPDNIRHPVDQANSPRSVCATMLERAILTAQESHEVDSLTISILIAGKLRFCVPRMTL